MEIINLDMVPGKKSPVCHASQYDDGRVIRFNLYDSGLPYTLDGTETITFEVRKPDGNIVTSTLTNTSDSYVDVVTTEQMTAVKGANLCEVRVEKGATNIGSLNVIMAVEMDPTDGGIASASEIDNLRSQISGMVAEEVADQYDAGSVIFDSAPTPGHGNGYAVTSEGVNNALAPKADRSELPDMSNYYTKSETDVALDDKVNTTDFDATNLPITSGSPTNTKEYIDGKTASDIEYSEGVSVADMLDELNSTSETFTPTLQNVSTNTGASEKIWYYKSGKVVTMIVDIILAQTSQNLLVFSFPAGYRPPVNMTMNAQALGSQANTMRYCTIYANGNVAFFSSDSARLLFTVVFGT